MAIGGFIGYLSRYSPSPRNPLVVQWQVQVGITYPIFHGYVKGLTRTGSFAGTTERQGLMVEHKAHEPLCANGSLLRSENDVQILSPGHHQPDASRVPLDGDVPPQLTQPLMKPLTSHRLPCPRPKTIALVVLASWLAGCRWLLRVETQSRNHQFGGGGILQISNSTS